MSETPTTESPIDAILRRACEAAWAPLPEPAEGEEGSSERRRRYMLLELVNAEFLRDVAPRLSDPKEGIGFMALLNQIQSAVLNGRLFLPGEIVRTPGMDGLSPGAATWLVLRHARAQHTACTDADAQANREAILTGERVLTTFTDIHDGDNFWMKVWVITERSEAEGYLSRLRLRTTILLPSEY